MKTAKQFLALLLSAILLCSFGVGANAVTPEEELEAYGRALLMQTMEDLRGDYTIYGTQEFLDENRSSQLHFIVHSGGNYVVMTYGRYDVEFAYELHLKDELLRIYPYRDGYRKISESEYTSWLQLLTPKEIATDAPISVTQNGTGICVSYDGLRYYYWNDLSRIEKDDLGYLTIYIPGFRNNEDYLKYFDISRMREATALQVWWWNIDWRNVWETLYLGVMYALTPILLPFYPIFFLLYLFAT